MKRKDIMFLLITTAIFVFIWIVFSIYHNLLTSTIPEILSIQITPISPTFDTKTLDKLKKREKFQPLFESAIIPSLTPSITHSQNPSVPSNQTATPSGSATSGGTLTP